MIKTSHYTLVSAAKGIKTSTTIILETGVTFCIVIAYSLS
jgi:hypothetical protein